MSVTPVVVLTSSLENKNPDYIAVFSDLPKYNLTFIAPQMPSVDWLDRMKQYMTTASAIELYNHLLVWIQVLETGHQTLILYNQSYPVQNLDQWEYLVSKALDKHYPLFFYGKYWDDCTRLRYVDNVAVNDVGFSIVRTFGAQGTFAYSVTQEAARKLISQLEKVPETLEQLFTRVVSHSIVPAYAYHPSIVIINGMPKTRFECRPSPTTNYLLWFIGIFIVGFLIALFIYFIYVNLSYTPPEKHIYLYETPSIQMESFIKSGNDMLPYGNVL